MFSMHGSAVDSSGNVYFSLVTSSPMLRSTSNPGFTGAVVKIDTDAELAWMRSIGTTEDLDGTNGADTEDFVGGVTTQSSSYVYAAGYTLNISNNRDAFVAKLDSDDGSKTWMYRFGGTASEHEKAVSIDYYSSNVYVCGTSTNSANIIYGLMMKVSTDGALVWA